MGSLKPDPAHPGLYYPNDSMVEDPPGSGLYTTGDLVEDPAGSGLYAFSEVTLDAPTVTVITDPPSVHVVFDESALPAGTASIILRKTFDGITLNVRDGLNKAAVGGVIVDDAEPPLGVDVVYQASAFNSAGVDLGTTVPVTVNIPVARGVAWLSDPRDATSGVRVELASSAGADLSRPTPGTRYQVGFKTIVLAGQTQLLTDLPMDFYTDDTATRDAVTNLMQGTGGLILIRTGPEIPIPRLLYCWASNPTFHPRSNLALDDPTMLWNNTVQEISEIPGTVVVHTVTWQTYMDAFPTWGNMRAAYTSWFDAMKNPPGGG